MEFKLELDRKCCPDCKCEEIVPYRTYETCENGLRTIFKCTQCQKCFSETKNTFMEGIRKPLSAVAQVIKARTEGIGVNATCRVYDISKNTLLDWERKLVPLKDAFLLYALLHTFLQQEIEGDELYTKVKEKVPVEDCEGWTIVLMDRASRFIWVLDCGEKDQKLFLGAMQIFKELIEQTEDISLLTDGERRYGNILFEICHEVIKSGKPGRPPKVLPEGVCVRVKNKGAQEHKKGPKRPKYQAPQSEHPNTNSHLEDKDIHANHVEAFNASLRRRLSAYTRKANTYAKGKDHLQRALDMYWLVHNFIRLHWTTKKIPAAVLGIVKPWFSFTDLLMAQLLT